jgi:hypothetical protein
MKYLQTPTICHKQTNKKAAPLKERLMVASAGITYLQFAQVQVEPQLQLAQVQFGLLHFTF